MTQTELFRAPAEEHRPKAKDPATVTVKEPTASPPVRPVKRSRVKGHDDNATYLQPKGYGGRVMLLESIVLAVRFEDPFYDRGKYPIEMGFDEFAAGAWKSADPLHVAEEYERLAIIPPDQIAVRCDYLHLHERYRKLLTEARAKINAELERLTTPEFRCT